MDRKDEWSIFFRQCLNKRIRAENFETLVGQMAERSAIKGSRLADTLLRTHPSTYSGADPLVLVYFDILLNRNYISVPDLLSSLLKGYSGNATKMDVDEAGQKLSNGEWRNPTEVEENLFYRIAKSFGNGERPRTVDEARQTMYILSQWMSVMVNASATDSVIQAVTGSAQQLQPQAILVREAFAVLLLATSENAKLLSVLDGSYPKGESRCFLTG